MSSRTSRKREQLMEEEELLRVFTGWIILVNGEMENWVGHWLNKRKIPLKEESQVLFQSLLSRNLKKKRKKKKKQVVTLPSACFNIQVYNM